jgi:D-alanine-D-alanine ligase
LEVDGEMHVLPVAEIHFVDYPEGKPHLVGYRAKWADDSFEYHHTPRSFDFGDRDHELVSDLSELARRACAEFGVGGYARVDFRVDENGRPWILELNTNPCLSPDAGFMAAAARAGYDLESVADALLCAARGAGSEKVSVS